MKLEKTITSIFIVPTLKIPKEQMSKNNFINGYIKDLNRDVQYENAVYLLFKPENIDVFREFVDSEYERTQELIDDYNYDDKHIVLVYQLDNNFKNDFEKWMNQYRPVQLDYSQSVEACMERFAEWPFEGGPKSFTAE